MPPPSMRSIFAKVHETSKSVVSRRNFSSPAAGDGKEPKKCLCETMKPLVTQTLVVAALAYSTGLFADRYLTLEGGGGGGGS